MPQTLFEVMQPQATDEDRRFDLCTQIDNILNSYDDEFDAFAELVQNSVDSLFERWDLAQEGFVPRVKIHVDCSENTLTVLDNGIGVAPNDFPGAITPNFSLKRRLRHRNARGEKGAALAFLQFGHHLFDFQSKNAAGKRSYSLRDGRSWFHDTLTVLNADGAYDEKVFPTDTFGFADTVSQEVDGLESGCRATVKFGLGCRLENLARTLGSDPKTALNRVEHILRTRTGIGFVVPSDDAGELPPMVRALDVEVQITFLDGTQETRKVNPGFQYPHLLAKAVGSKCSLMTNPTRDSELLYDFITPEFLRRYFPHFMAVPQNREIVEKYAVNGYVSYAHQNGYYEQTSAAYLNLELDNRDQYNLVQINGGFQIAVKDYPNGRRHTFLHRSGAEDKSRTYIVLNFRNAYKPDYGRKNVSAEVRPFVNEICKALITFATGKERKQNLKTGRQEARHDVLDVREARLKREDEGAELRRQGVWVDTMPPLAFRRKPIWEAEVAAEFVDHIRTGRLPGFRLYGLPAALQVDSLFDYRLDRSAEVIYDAARMPLGVLFPDGRQQTSFAGGWLEFKLTSDMLTDDFRSAPGAPAKKYFTLVDLLVCYEVDDAVEGYRVEAIDDTNIQQRLFFGVTHLLQSDTDVSHTVQVICLEELRKRFGLDGQAQQLG